MAKPDAERVLTLLVVDDHWLFRHALVRLLGDQPFLRVIGEAPDGETAIQLAIEHRPDVVLMDVVMPKLGGIDATRKIAEALPEAQIVGMTVGESPDAQAAMLEAGAVSCLGKHHFPDSLLHLLERIRDER